MKVILKYTGHHQREGNYEVDEKKVDSLLVRGDFERLGSVPKSKPKPSISWTEKKIKAWILQNNIPLDYDIERDTKKEMLKRLKDGGYL